MSKKKAANLDEGFTDLSIRLTENSLLKVGEAAKFLGVSIDTLRRWEEKGVLTPFRTPGSTRLYTGKQLLEVNPSLKFIRNPNFNKSLYQRVIGFGLTYFSYVAAFFTVIAIVYFALADNSAKILSNLPFIVNFEKDLLSTSSSKIEPQNTTNDYLTRAGAKLELSKSDAILGNNRITPISQNSAATASWQSAYESCMLKLKELEKQLPDK